MRIVVVMLGLMLLCAAAWGNGSDNSRLLAPIEGLEINDQPLPLAAQMIARSAKMPVAIEWVDSKEDNPTRISLHLAAGLSISTALDAAIAQDSRYEWKFSNGWLHIMPRVRQSDWPLDASFIGDLPVSNSIIPAVPSLLSNLRTRGWIVQMPMSFSSKADSSKILRHTDLVPISKQLSMRDALDIIVWRCGGSGWEIFPSKSSDGRSIVVVEPVIY